MNDGPVITLAEQTSVSIDHIRNRWKVVAKHGQLRVVHDGETTLRLVASHSELWPERAIVMLRNQHERTCFELVAGKLSYCSSRIRSARIATPGAFLAVPGQPLRRIDSPEWTLHSEQIQLAAAQQTTPLLQVPSSPSPSQRAPGSVASDDGSLAPMDEVLRVEEEEEDELPRLAQEPPPAATRAAVTNDEIGAETAVAALASTFGGSSSLNLGAFSSASGTFASGGIFGDANQQTFQGMEVGTGDPFPGAIHLVTGETRLPFDNVHLATSEFGDLFGAAANKFFSIGTGAAPTGQVVTNFFTGTSPTPNVIDVPRFNAHLIELDQYAIPDPAQGALDSNIGLTGLIGPVPTGPTVVGAAPLVDERAQLNSGATFALGEFLVAANGTNKVTFTIRRSDQDRLIVKDPGGNDANDQVTPNTEVVFDDTVDPRFLPQSPTVKTPRPNDSLANTGTGIKDLNFLRRAAFTTLVADQLHDYSRRTGQTRFVVDGKIIDISGFRP
jgi:hypothetical protein